MALCAAALTYQGFLLLIAPLPLYELLLFVFFATLFSYNVHFTLASSKTRTSRQLQWFARRKLFIFLMNIVSLLLLILLLIFTPLHRISISICATVALNAAYTAPLLFRKPFHLPILFTFLKSYFIGFTWAVVTVVLPAEMYRLSLGSKEIAVFVFHFLLVAVSTLLFDYRDKHRDQDQFIRTPANLMNKVQFQGFFLLNLLLLILAVVWLVLALNKPVLWIQLLQVPYLWWLYNQSQKRTDDLFYLSMVDGVLLLSPALSFILLI